MISSGKKDRALNKEVGGRCLVLDDGGTPSLKFRDQPRSDVTSDEAASAGHDPILAAGTDDRDWDLDQLLQGRHKGVGAKFESEI